MDQAALALAVDIGGTKLETTLVDRDGTLIESSRTRRPTGPTASSEELDRALADAVRETMSHERASEVAGAGIGCAGPVDARRGTVSPLNIRVWCDHDVVSVVRSASGLDSVRLEVDGMCIALAEYWRGAGQDAKNLMSMIVSTGIGGGLVLSGRAHGGRTGNAGHIGHIEVAGFDDPCPCGGSGCLEAIASGPSTVRFAQSRGFQGSRGEDLAAAYREGDPIAREAVERAGVALGRGIGNASALLDLDVVTIGGGFVNVSDDLLEIARRELGLKNRLPYVADTVIMRTGLGSDGPLLGAAGLVLRPDLVH